MKKIPTLFERVFENHKVVSISNKVTPGMEWVLEGQGLATLKWDGSCCAIINGELYKRYDAKKGKKPPEGAIPCCDPDPVTGHHPHWVKVDAKNPDDKWFIKAYENTFFKGYSSVLPSPVPITYEAIGPHFNGNPQKCPIDRLVQHGLQEVYMPERSFEGIFEYLRTAPIEGIVFWKNGEPMCKIKRTDFGFEWPVKEE